MISINTIAVHYISTILAHSAQPPAHFKLSLQSCPHIICETYTADFTSNNNHAPPNTTRNYTNKTYTK